MHPGAVPGGQRRAARRSRRPRPRAAATPGSRRTTARRRPAPRSSDGGVLGVHDQQGVERGHLGQRPVQLGRRTSAGNSGTPLSTRKHLKPRTPASRSAPRPPRDAGTAPPQKPTSTWHFPAAASRLVVERGHVDGGRDGVQRHVDERGDAAGRGRPGRRAEALPLGAARLVDVHVGVDQPRQQHLVVGQRDVLGRRPPRRRAARPPPPGRRAPAPSPGGARRPAARSR